MLFAQNKQTIQQVIKELREADLQLIVEGTIADFLGVSVTNTGYGIHLNQPLIISKILQDLHTNRVNNPPMTPSNPSAIPHDHKDGAAFDNSFNYQAMTGKLMYLERGSRPDLAYPVHQCAKYASNPRRAHGQAIRRIVKYLCANRDKGTLLKPHIF